MAALWSPQWLTILISDGSFIQWISTTGYRYSVADSHGSFILTCQAGLKNDPVKRTIAVDMNEQFLHWYPYEWVNHGKPCNYAISTTTFEASHQTDSNRTITCTTGRKSLKIQNSTKKNHGIAFFSLLEPCQFPSCFAPFYQVPRRDKGWSLLVRN